MTVHFPIALMISVTVFNLLYLVTGVGTFEMTAFHCLGGGVVFTMAAILTGQYTWWLNYLSRPVKAITVKRRASLIMLLVGIAAFLWRLFQPDVLTSLTGAGWVYLAMVMSFFPIVTVIGWFGAQLTFPIED